MTNMLTVFCDGGSRGNPGPAAWAFVIYKDKQKLHEDSGYLGIATNNVAEYTALIEALTWLVEVHKDDEIAVFMDSELAVKQLNGLYKVKNPKIRELYQVARTKGNVFQQIAFTHIPREKNWEADKLVNITLDSKWN